MQQKLQLTASQVNLVAGHLMEVQFCSSELSIQSASASHLHSFFIQSPLLHVQNNDSSQRFDFDGQFWKLNGGRDYFMH